MISYIIPTIEQKPDNIALHKATNDLENMDTPEDVTMGMFNLAMTYQIYTNCVFIFGKIWKA